MSVVLRPFFLHRRLSATALLLVVAVPAAAQPATPPLDLCQLPATTEGAARVRVDARTGRIDPADSTHFPANTPVEVVLHSKNPLRYEYTVVVEAEDLEARIIRDFLKLAGIQEPGAPSAPTPLGGVQQPPISPAPLPCASAALSVDAREACREVARARNEIVTGEARLTNLTAALQAAAERVAKAWERAMAGPSTVAECEQIVKGLAGIGAQLDQLISLEHQGATPISLRDRARAQHGTITTATARLQDKECDATAADQQQACREELATLRTSASDALTAAARLEENSQTLADSYGPQVATRRAQKELIAEVLRSPNSFVETIRLARRPDPTAFRLTVERKERVAPHAESSLAVDEIAAGTSRFTVSGGIGISMLEAREFGRQSGVDEDGAVVPVFAVTEQSDERIVGLVQLNGCWARCREAYGSFHWSLGIGLGAGEAATDISLYTGPAFGFIDSKLLLSLAYHQRERERLVGFRVGEPIPDGLNDPLPTRRERTGALLVTVTYKLR